jgi:superfamily II DNA or RNA helicase
MSKLTILIKDETNCKIVGLSTSTRNELVKQFKYRIPGAQYIPAVRLGRWDGCKNFFQLSGMTYITLLPEILPSLLEQGYEIEVDDQRTYNTSFSFTPVTEESYSHMTWPENHQLAGQPIMLRDYQVSAINTFFENPQSIQSISTGGGKCLSGETRIELYVNKTKLFGKFLNQFGDLQQSNINITILPISKLATAIEKFKNTELQNNSEIDILDLSLLIPTSHGLTPIHSFIKKCNLPTIAISIDNGYSFVVAEKHILVTDHNTNIYANDLKIGDKIKHREYVATVTNIVTAGIRDCYDISIEIPHLYYDYNGVLHHNTLTSAVLAHRCEPYGRTIIIVPSKDLVRQTEVDYRNLGLDVGVLFGDRKEYDRTHEICTWQSLNAMLKKTQAGSAEVEFSEFVKNVSCVMVDECLAAGTLVEGPNGSCKIEELITGDLVYSFDEALNDFIIDEVVKVHINLTVSQQYAMFKVKTDYCELQITGNHKVLTMSGWMPIDQVNENDFIKMYANHNFYVKVLEKQVIEKPTTTYNLHVKTNHNYIANGLVVANCHGLKADALLTMMTTVLSHIPLRWGFTGTIPKEDFQKRSLQISIGDVVGKVTALELQDKGVLSKCHINIKQLVDYATHKTYQDELRYLLDTKERIEAMAGMIMEIAKTGNTLVLIDRIEPGKYLVDCMPGSVFLSGSSKSDTRRDRYAEIEKSENSITVASTGITAVGINLINVYNLVLIEPGKSFVRVIQSIGRGLRKGSEKEFVNVYDITSSCRFSKRHLTKRKEFYREAGYPFSIDKIDWIK